MQVLILRSEETIKEGNVTPDFSTRMNTRYAKRVINNLRNTGYSCGACGKLCISCRKKYSTDLSEYISGIISFPAILPAIIENPDIYIPQAIPQHDTIIAISVNEEILMSFIEKDTQVKGVVIPIEETKWVSPYARKTIERIAIERNIEISFPKPFCSFNPGNNKPFLSQLKNALRIGLPEVEIRIKDGVVGDVSVKTSAPCGCTYFTAKQLIGRKLTEDLVQIIDNAISAYPCTAGREVDPEYGDSITHRAVKVQRVILKGIPQFEEIINSKTY